jgi:hypothetical protein
MVKYKDPKASTSRHGKAVSFARSSCKEGRIQKSHPKPSERHPRGQRVRRRRPGFSNHSTSSRNFGLTSLAAAQAMNILDSNQSVPDGSPDENVRVMATIMEEPQQSGAQEPVDELSLRLGNVNLASQFDEDMAL